MKRRGCGVNRALVAMVGAMFCFSLANLCVRVLTHAGAVSQQALFISTLGVSLVLGAVLYFKHGWIGLIGHNRRTLLIRGLTGFGSGACFLYTISKMTLADAAMIQYLNPLFVAVLAPFINRERVRKAHWVMFGVALIGAALLMKPKFEYAPWPALVGLAGAALSGIAYSYVRALRKTEDERTIILYYSGLSVILAFPGLGYRWSPIPASIWWVAPGMVLGLLAGQLLMTYGLTRESGARATGVTYSAVVFNALWGYLFFRETVDTLSFIGAALVVAGVVGIAAVKDKPELDVGQAGGE